MRDPETNQKHLLQERMRNVTTAAQDRSSREQLALELAAAVAFERLMILRCVLLTPTRYVSKGVCARHV